MDISWCVIHFLKGNQCGIKHSIYGEERFCWYEITDKWNNNVAFKAVSASCAGTVSWNLQLLMLPTTMDWFYCWETSTSWPLEPHKSLWINHCMIERVHYMWEQKCWFDVFDRYTHCMHPWNTWYRETNNIILPHTITHILKQTQSKTKQN